MKNQQGLSLAVLLAGQISFVLEERQAFNIK